MDWEFGRRPMQFSVVIPVYNREHLIQETLDSVLNQSFDDYEVVVVDDGSTDRTLSVLESYGDEIRLLTQNNRGPGAARNRGIEAADGKYVAFLDSDDRWFPWTLSTYSNIIQRYESPAILKGAKVYFEGGNILERHEKGPIRVDQHSDFLKAAGQGIYVSTNVAVVKRDALEKVGGFTTLNINAEDHDLAFRLGDQPGFLQVQSPPLVAVRRHEGQVTGNLEKTWDGFAYLLDQEEAAAYPGGEVRQKERRYLLTQHMRSASISLARKGHFKKALELYRRTLWWQMSFGRMKYLMGFPISLGWEWLKQFRDR